MKTEALIFIHPNDFFKIMKSEEGPIDVIIYPWHDGLKVLRIHGYDGVPYRITSEVPEEKVGTLAKYYPDLEKDPPGPRLQRMIYGCVASEVDWLDKDEEFIKSWRVAHPDWTPDSPVDEEPCKCVLCTF